MTIATFFMQIPNLSLKKYHFLCKYPFLEPFFISIKKKRKICFHKFITQKFAQQMKFSITYFTLTTYLRKSIIFYANIRFIPIKLNFTVYQPNPLLKNSNSF